MASPSVLHQTTSHRPSLHRYTSSTPNTFANHPVNHTSAAYTYLNQSLLYPSTLPSPSTATTKTLGNSRSTASLGSERTLRIMTSASERDLSSLAKCASPSISVRTFVTAVDVADCESPMSLSKPSPVESNRPVNYDNQEQEQLKPRTNGPGDDPEMERLIKQLTLDEGPKSKQRRRKSSRATGGSKQSSRRSSVAQSQSTSPSSSTRAKIETGEKVAHRPRIPRRTSSRTIDPVRRATLVSLHRNSKNLFQSIGAALEDPPLSPTDTTTPVRPRPGSSHSGEKRALRDSQLNGRGFSGIEPYAGEGTGESPLLPQGKFSTGLTEEVEDIEAKPYKPVPATVIDWTHPSTRRREYQKIDKSRAGVRGLWKKVSPKWCRAKDVRTPFYTGDEKDSDAGSVRRYRIEDEEVGAVAINRKWGCFGVIGGKP